MTNDKPLREKKVFIPADVPFSKRFKYLRNYNLATHKSGRLMLFAGDQKAEHLNGDFYGEGISADDNTPEHLFRIASQAKIGVFAAQLGMIAKYGKSYKNVPYLVKLNSKTGLVKTEQKDPLSKQWISIKQVVEFQKNSGLEIVGVGYTVYLGSEFETEMLKEAAQIVYEAHKNGLITVIWMYPRGKAVKDELDPHLVAGATGVGCCLGTDFVKVNYPKQKGQKSEDILKEAILSAGRTKVVCAGGGSMDVKTFLTTLHAQINIAGASGNATGRNVHQKPLAEAIRFCNAIYAITVEGEDVDFAMMIYEGKPALEVPEYKEVVKEEPKAAKEKEDKKTTEDKK